MLHSGIPRRYTPDSLRETRVVGPLLWRDTIARKIHAANSQKGKFGSFGTEKLPEGSFLRVLIVTSQICCRYPSGLTVRQSIHNGALLGVPRCAFGSSPVRPSWRASSMPIALQDTPVFMDNAEAACPPPDEAVANESSPVRASGRTAAAETALSC
jgi:hypothetical protein